MQKNIIVFLLDTARASDVYGNPSMPVVNRLARRGAAYLNAISPGTWTAPAHASLFMNDKVSHIRNSYQNFFDNGTYKIDPWMVKTKFLEDRSDTLASKLSRLGYKSVLFSNNPFLTSFTNLAQGFDKVYDLWMHSNVKYNKSLVKKLDFIINGGPNAKMRMYQLSYLLTLPLPGRALDRLYLNLRLRLDRGVARADGTHELDRGAVDTERALTHYLTRDYDYRPHFMFLNLMEAHENYPLMKSDATIQDKWLYLGGILDLGPDITKKLHDGYMKRLAYLDMRFGRMLSVLKANGLLDNATVVVTSDHGQLFGEHDLLYHSIFPYQNVARVPLIAANYENGKIVEEGDRVERPVSLLALHDSIMNLASGKEEHLNGNLRKDRYVTCEHGGISEGWDEQLLKLLKGRSDYARQIYDAKRRLNVRATAVYHRDMKLIHYFGGKKDELYNLSSDPSEEDNLIDRSRDKANDLLHHVS
jgi:arylsulfatase A-like enzyme